MKYYFLVPTDSIIHKAYLINIIIHYGFSLTNVQFIIILSLTS